MTDKLIFIPNKVTQNYPFCRVQLGIERLYTQPTNENSSKVPKVFKLNKTLGTLQVHHIDRYGHPWVIEMNSLRFYNQHLVSVAQGGGDRSTMDGKLNMDV